MSKFFTPLTCRLFAVKSPLVVIADGPVMVPLIINETRNVGPKTFKRYDPPEFDVLPIIRHFALSKKAA